jgi:hypothetical protein
MEPNPLRSEVIVTIGGKAYGMRPAYSAIVKIEKALNTRLIKLMERLQFGDIGVEDVATILACFINANPDNPGKVSVEQIGDKIIEEGFINFLQPLAEVFGFIIKAGPKNKSESESGNVGTNPPSSGAAS